MQSEQVNREDSGELPSPPKRRSSSLSNLILGHKDAVSAEMSSAARPKLFECFAWTVSHYLTKRYLSVEAPFITLQIQRKSGGGYRQAVKLELRRLHATLLDSTGLEQIIFGSAPKMSDPSRSRSQSASKKTRQKTTSSTQMPATQRLYPLSLVAYPKSRLVVYFADEEVRQSCLDQILRG